MTKLFETSLANSQGLTLPDFHQCGSRGKRTGYQTLHSVRQSSFQAQDVPAAFAQAMLGHFTYGSGVPFEALAGLLRGGWSIRQRLGCPL